MSVHDVARKTRISTRWIEALEGAELDGLPAEVFVSGYLRSYASAVGLDGQDVLARYHALIQQRGQPASVSERSSRGQGRRAAAKSTQRLVWAVWLGLVLLLGLTLLVVAWRRSVL